ncbi:hypothetical protein [Nannocystis punicea]|uniref:Uncharacterized protein n=1 Tax=Nannocystis punicea TaxID=2995304 RepID=A0ABY7H573_9BACT|nr:hypothetical protein [Nannocystis poenicansa]WAS94235.1 hypothetical protein O0S08_49565 [Nannocystis poenicansa]
MRRTALTLVMTTLGCSPHTSPPEPKVAVAATPAEAPPESPEPPAPREPLPPKQPPASTTWTTLTVVPGCELQIADTPASLGPPLAWTQCKDGPDGCLEASTQTAGALAPDVDVVGLSHGGQVTIAALLSLSGPRSRYVLAPRDGLPFFAVEGAREVGCSLGHVGISDDGAVIEVLFDHDDGYASRAYLRGPLAEDASWREVAAVLPRRQFPQFIGESVLSVGGRVMVEQNGGPLRWYDPKDRRWVEVPGSHDGWECCASGHGDAVVFSYAAIPERPMAARLGERAHPLRRGPVAGMSPVMIDGARAAWLEGSGRDNNNIYKKIDLWTADVVEGPALANARHVLALPLKTMPMAHVGGGVVAIRMPERADGLRIVRLDPLEQRVLRAPAGLTIERLLWITSDEVAVRIGPGEMSAKASVMRRIPLAALPPWTEK